MAEPAWKIQETPEFSRWLARLSDLRARAAVLRRIERIAQGAFGDARAVGEGVNELKIDHGPGYRVYFVRRGELLIVLLCGGHKGSQSRDIKRAKSLALEV